MHILTFEYKSNYEEKPTFWNLQGGFSVSYEEVNNVKGRGRSSLSFYFQCICF